MRHAFGGSVGVKGRGLDRIMSTGDGRGGNVAGVAAGAPKGRVVTGRVEVVGPVVGRLRAVGGEVSGIETQLGAEGLGELLAGGVGQVGKARRTALALALELGVASSLSLLAQVAALSAPEEAAEAGTAGGGRFGGMLHGWRGAKRARREAIARLCRLSGRRGSELLYR